MVQLDPSCPYSTNMCCFGVIKFVGTLRDFPTSFVHHSEVSHSRTNKHINLFRYLYVIFGCRESNLGPANLVHLLLCPCTCHTVPMHGAYCAHIRATRLKYSSLGHVKSFGSVPTGSGVVAHQHVQDTTFISRKLFRLLDITSCYVVFPITFLYMHHSRRNRWIQHKVIIRGYSLAWT